MLESRLLPDALVAMDKVDEAKGEHVGKHRAEEIPGGQVRRIEQTGADGREYLGQRRRSRHQHDADPQSPKACQRRYLIAAAREFRPRHDDHGSAQHEDGP